MIDSEVYTLSRGDITKEVIQGNSRLAYFPFHLGTDYRNKSLVPWINSRWTRRELLVHLSVKGWFDKVFEEENYLWTSPLVVARVVVGQFCRSYHL